MFGNNDHYLIRVVCPNGSIESSMVAAVKPGWELKFGLIYILGKVFLAAICRFCAD